MYIAISNSITSSSQINGAAASGGGGGGFNNTYSLAFDGIDDVLETPVLAPIETQLWTLSTWVKWNNLTGSNEAIFSTRQNGLATSTGFDLYITDSGGNLRARTYKGNGIGAQVIISTSTYGITTGVWYNIVCIYNSGTLSVSINDGAVFSGSASGNYTASGVNPTIGKWRNGSGYHDGNIDEVAIWGTDETANISTISTSPVVDLTSLSPIVWLRNGDNGTWKSPQWLIPNNENKDKFSNYSFSYDGVDDYVNCGTDSSLKPTSAYSVSGWFKLDDLTGTKTVISNDNNNGYMTWVAGDKLWFYHYDTNWRTITSNTTLVADTWYHFALTWDLSSTTGNLYINGVFDNQNTSFNQVTYLSTPVYIGTYGPSVYFEGNIDDIAVFNKVLTPTEISSIYNSGVPNDLSSLSPVGYWRSENSTFLTNWTVTDNGSGGNDGTSANMTIEDRVGDASNSISNAVSFNMDEVDRESDTPS